jgi:hypothetical protein
MECFQNIVKPGVSGSMGRVGQEDNKNMHSNLMGMQMIVMQISTMQMSIAPCGWKVFIPRIRGK